MVLTQLSEVFVASGINQVNESTFTALYHGYNLRGKIIVPAVPTVDFIFYGDIDPDIQSVCDDFVPKLFEKYGRFPIKVGNNFFSVLLDLSVRDAENVKAILSEITGFMMANNCGAIGTLPPEPVEVPVPDQQMPAPAVKPNPVVKQKQQPQPQAEVKPVPKPPEPEITVPFENHLVLARVLKIFMLGINKISENSFTTLYHGYNVVGKMPTAAKEIIELTFYGEATVDISADIQEFAGHMSEKYGDISLKNMGGSINVVINISGRADSDVKTILGEVSGFMMKHSIVAINFPNTVPKGTPYDPDSKESAVNNVSETQQPVNQPRTQYAYAPVSAPQKNNESFVGKFFKKFGKKP